MRNTRHNTPWQEQYKRILERFLSDMAAVRAPLEDYEAALKDAKAEIDVAVQASKEFSCFSRREE